MGKKGTENNINWKSFITVLSSVIVSLTIGAKWDLMPETYLSNPILEFFSRLSYSFSVNNFSDVLIFIGIFYIIKTINKRESKVNVFTLIVALIFAFTYLMSLSFMNYSSMILFNRDGYQLIYSFFLLIGGTLILYYIIRTGSFILTSYKMINSEDELYDNCFITKHCFAISFITISVCWLFWQLCAYPGTCNFDAIYQLSQYFSEDTSNWSTYHPPFSTLIMGTLISLGKLIFKNADMGYFLYLLLQTVVGAFVFSYGIYILSKEFRINKTVITIITLFFAIVPFWGIYAAMFEKSLLYSELATLITILILPVVKNKSISKKQTVALCITCVLSCYLRNNGIYAVVPTLVALAIYLKQHYRKRMIASLLVVLAVWGGVNSLLYPSLGIEKGPLAEALSLPFQQTAKYVKYYDNEVTEEEKTIINGILEYDELGEKYDPKVSNPVKETYKGNSMLADYLVVWVKMFFKHPGIYFSAFIDSSYGYIAPVNQSIETTTDFDYETTGLQNFGLTEQKHLNAVQLTNSLRTLSLNMPIIRYLSMPGLYTWFLMLAIILTVKRNKKMVIITFMPAIINILVCFASPLSTSMRYAAPTVASAPFLVATVLYYVQTRE